MMQLFEDEQLIGKKIQRIGYVDNTYALFFDDKTYAIFRGCGWDEHDVELMDETYSLEPTMSNASDLCGMGVITKEQYMKIRSTHSTNQKIRNEEIEREQYIRLKEKYG